MRQQLQNNNKSLSQPHYCSSYNLTLIIMKYTVLFIILLACGCLENPGKENNPSSASAANISNDTIPVTRKQVSKSPVAAYMIPINNPLLHQYFGAKVYETPYTFKYLLRMQYEGMIETDTLNIP